MYTIRNFLNSARSNPFVTGTAVMFIGSMSINVINYLYHLIMGRMLGPESYGALASIYSILYIASIIPLSTSVTIVKFVSAAKNLKAKANVYYGIRNIVKNIAIAGCVLIVVTSPVVAGFLHISSILPIALVGPIFYFSVMAIFDQAALQGILKFNGVVVSNLVSSGGKLSLGVLLILLGTHIQGAIFAVFVSVFCAYLITQIHIRKSFRRVSVKNNNFSNIFLYSIPVFIQALAFTSLFTVDLILVKHLFPEYEAGLYAALSTLGKIIYFASSPISTVMFPLVSGKRSKGEKYRYIFYISFVLTFIASSIATLVYLLLPELMISTLYGVRYVPGAESLVWMALFISVYTLCQLLTNFLLSINHTNVSYFSLIAAIIQVPLIWTFHETLTQVIQISLITVCCLFISLIGYMLYRELQLSHAQTTG